MKQLYVLFTSCLVFLFLTNSKAQIGSAIDRYSAKTSPSTKRSSTEKRWIKHEVSTLCTRAMAGRGYVNKGRERAAKHVERKFKEFGLAPVTTDSTYLQTYSFPVNTFPGNLTLKLNKKIISPGDEYLIDAASNGYMSEKLKVKSVNLDKIEDSTDMADLLKKFETGGKMYVLKNVDSLCKRMNIRNRDFASLLPKGCYIIPQYGKMTWTVATDTIPATVFYVEDSAMPRLTRKASVDVQNKFITDAKSQNVIGCVPGTIKDSFIVFTAHYDHLGMMGKEIYFPGASDNASGTAMMLYLANYFAQHPQRYTMVFIAFSGEEAGLKGSQYFVKHPLIPLDHIRFLTNLDIMGDATAGVTVVNATEYEKEFNMLQSINEKGGYLPAIKSRGKAANSDHYFFTEAGVPSFFIYSNGGKGYYHDIFDMSSELSYQNIDGVAKMLIEFAQGLQ